MHRLRRDENPPGWERRGHKAFPVLRLLIIAGEVHELHAGVLAGKLNSRLKEFVTPGVVVVRLASGGTDNCHEVLLLKPELRPDAGVRDKSWNIDIFFDARVFQNPFRTAWDNFIRNHSRAH